ncbi:MAG: sigma-54-dependent Fis family transcriptional regulator [Gammaproteobacteria bacterium]|nr:sigma-54-dependent Fis family transcriptional regulator [Gammaproteobacteria bacterium]
MSKQILVVEDDRVLNKLLVKQLSSEGFSVTGVCDPEEMRKRLAVQEPDLILLDDHLPKTYGSKLLPELSPFYPVIMLTAYGSVRDAVKVVQAGASDYLTKPVDSSELLLVVKRVLEKAELSADLNFYKEQSLGKQRKFLIGESSGLRDVQNLIDIVAPSDMTVLIYGESGVGKELVAKELHQRSNRRDGNFIAIDCCTIQESLFESELFGHERGSFTGANRRKKGLIETAEKGTLFMDEIGEITPPIQAKLLRVLETGMFRRVGSTSDQTANVRIVAATNRNLEQMVAEGEFRRDLLYRLNAFTVTMPPLRDRSEDIPALVEHFIHHHDFSRKVVKRVSPAAMRRLSTYVWPGNVRELRNVIERAIILSQEQPEILPEHLGFSTGHKPGKSSHNNIEFSEEPSIAEIEKKYLGYLLKTYEGHRGRIATAMGVSERNIYRLLQKYKLSG